MPCYHPRERWQIDWNKNPEAATVLVKKTGELVGRSWIEYNIDQEYSRGISRKDCIVEYIPCKQCLGCRLEYSREWAIRQTAEAETWGPKMNWFLTLTQDDDHLYYTEKGLMPSVEPNRISDFMKTLRKSAERKGWTGIRFYGTSEYGAKNGRPHYHINLFNCPAPNLWKLTEPKVSGSGFIYYQCPDIEKMWRRGFITIAPFSTETAAYVARYVLKKAKNNTTNAGYKALGVLPEKPVMSRKPGIGYDYYTANSEKIYPADQINLGKFKNARPAAYYDRLFDELHHREMVDIKLQRKEKAIEAEKIRQTKSTLTKTESLEIAERNKSAQVQRLKRMIEE